MPFCISRPKKKALTDEVGAFHWLPAQQKVGYESYSYGAAAAGNLMAGSIPRFSCILWV